MTSEFLHSLKVAVTAAEPTPSSKAATDVGAAAVVVDVVGAKTGAHQFLEQIGLFVGALGGAEAGQAPALAVGEFFSSRTRRASWPRRDFA